MQRRENSLPTKRQTLAEVMAELDTLDTNERRHALRGPDGRFVHRDPLRRWLNAPDRLLQILAAVSLFWLVLFAYKYGLVQRFLQVGAYLLGLLLAG